MRVFLADDHPVVLSGMKALVAGDPAIELVGEATDGPNALRRAIELRPDVAVLDLSMPGLNGIEVARKLLAACPDCRVLVLTVHEDGAYLRQVLELGVSGYVLKRSATEELIRGIHAVASGGSISIRRSPAAQSGAPRRIRPARARTARSPNSAPAKSRCCGWPPIGHSNKTIAAKLQIGAKSVETYKARGMAKLGFHNRVEVVRFALSMGWLGDPS